MGGRCGTFCGPCSLEVRLAPIKHEDERGKRSDVLLQFALSFELPALRLRSYSDLIESFFDARLRKTPAQMVRDYGIDHTRGLAAESELIVDYRQMFRRSVVVLAISEVEASFLFSARALKLSTGTELSFSELHGTVFERFRKYASKHLRLAFPSDGPEWKELLDLQRIRHVIVHSACSIADSEHREPITRYVAAVPTLEVVDDRLVLKTGFVDHVIAAILKFHSVLRSALMGKSE